MAQNRQEVLIERPEGGRCGRMTVLATKAAYGGLAEQLAAIGRPIVVGFEATGNYHRTLAHRLLTAGLELRLISSVALARTRETLLGTRTTRRTRRSSCTCSASVPPSAMSIHSPPGSTISNELSKTHEVVAKMKTQTWHRILIHYLPLNFSEIGRFVGDSRSDWFLALIKRFPTSASIAALDREGFSAEASPLIGCKVFKARLINDVHETTCSSAMPPVPVDSAAITMFRMVIAQGRSLIHQRDEIERLAHARLAEHVDYQPLRKIPGIGPITALTILAEAGDLRRFNHHRQFLKFCGLDLATCEPGAFRSRTKLSKCGNARLRRTFWMAAQVAARQRDNSFHDKLGQYIAGHADDADRRRKAVTALTAKTARVAHAVIKTGTEYRPFVERSHARWKDHSLQVP